MTSPTRSGATEIAELSALARLITPLQSSRAATTEGDQPILAASPASLRGHEVVAAPALKTIHPPGEVDRYRLEPGDLLVSLHLPLEIAELDPALDLEATPAIATGSLSVVRVDPVRADATYIAWALRQPGARRDLEALASGSTVRFVKQRHLGALALPIPPLARQKQIAAALRAEQRIRTLESALAHSRRLYVDTLAAQAVRR